MGTPNRRHHAERPRAVSKHGDAILGGILLYPARAAPQDRHVSPTTSENAECPVMARPRSGVDGRGWPQGISRSRGSGRFASRDIRNLDTVPPSFAGLHDAMSGAPPTRVARVRMYISSVAILPSSIIRPTWPQRRCIAPARFRVCISRLSSAPAGSCRQRAVELLAVSGCMPRAMHAIFRISHSPRISVAARLRQPKGPFSSQFSRDVEQTVFPPPPPAAFTHYISSPVIAAAL